MPDINGRGQVVGGVGDTQVSIDNVAFGRGGCACWLTDDFVIYNGVLNGRWALLIYDQQTQETIEVGMGANAVAAGGGRWAAQSGGFLSANFDFQPGSLLSLSKTDSRGAASPLGAVALCPTNEKNVFDVYWPEGRVDRISAVAYGLEIIDHGQYLWDGGEFGYECRTSIPLTSRRVAEMDDGDWIVGWNDQFGLVAQLNGATDGYILEANPVAFHHRARNVNGRLMVAWSTSSQEAPGQQVLRYVDRSLPRVPLVLQPPIPDEPVGPRSEPVIGGEEIFDLLYYVVGDPSAWPRKGPTHPMHQVVQGNAVFFVKFGTDLPAPYVPGEAYEHWAWDANWIYHLEDGSAEPYSFKDPRWYPRVTKIGQAHRFQVDDEIQFHKRGSCERWRTDPAGRRMWVHAYYPAYYWGKDLGVRPTIVVAYDPTGGVDLANRSVELGFYAFGAGSVRWESYYGDQVYPNGWQNPAQFPESARWARSDFYLLGGPALQPKRTGCVGDTIPHYPPFDPHPPEPPKYPIITPHEVAMTQTVALIGPGGLYASVDPITKKLTFDRTSVAGDWEHFVAEKPDDRGRHQLRSVSSGLILGVDSTQHGSNDIRKLYYLLPESKRGNYESFFLGQTPNGLILAMVEYIDQGVVTKPFAPVNLTVVEL